MNHTRDYGDMLIRLFRKIQKYLILAVVLLLLASCGTTNSESYLSDKIQTNFSNLEINVWNAGIFGSIEFFVTSPTEIKSLRLDTDIPHSIYLEQVTYESRGKEGLFLQGIDYYSEEMSDADSKKLDDAEKIESIRESFASSDEVADYYFYYASLDFKDRSQFSEKDTITQMIVTTDEEITLGIGKINVMPSDAFIDFRETPIIRNSSQAFGMTTNPSPKRAYLEKQGVSAPAGVSYYETTKDIIIDRITLVDEKVKVDEMIIGVNTENGQRAYAFTEDTLGSMNLTLAAGNSFNIDTSFFVITDSEDLIYMQSYDYIIHYHDADGNTYELLADSGYISSTYDWLIIAASDEIKKSIQDYYFEYLPRMEQNSFN